VDRRKKSNVVILGSKSKRVVVALLARAGWQVAVHHELSGDGRGGCPPVMRESWRPCMVMVEDVEGWSRRRASA